MLMLNWNKNSSTKAWTESRCYFPPGRIFGPWSCGREARGLGTSDHIVTLAPNSFLRLRCLVHYAHLPPWEHQGQAVATNNQQSLATGAICDNCKQGGGVSVNAGISLSDWLSSLSLGTADTSPFTLRQLQPRPRPDNKYPPSPVKCQSGDKSNTLHRSLHLLLLWVEMKPLRKCFGIYCRRLFPKWKKLSGTLQSSSLCHLSSARSSGWQAPVSKPDTTKWTQVHSTVHTLIIYNCTMGFSTWLPPRPAHHLSPSCNHSL